MLLPFSFCYGMNMKIIKTLENTYKKAQLYELYKNDLITLKEYQRALKDITNISDNKLDIKSLWR